MTTCSNTLSTLKGQDILIKAGNGFAAEVTFTEATDLVSAVAHGLSDDDQVEFSVITTTTGIVVDTKYFVVNSNVNDFQVAATAGGTPLVLTTDGTGTAVEVFRALGGLQNASLAFASELQEITNTLSLEYREILDKAGVRSMTVTGSGFAVDDWGTAKLRALFANNCINRFQVCLFDNDTVRKYWEGCYKLTAFNQGGDYNTPQNFDLTLESTGEFTYNEV